MLATADDVEARLGRDLTAGEAVRVDGLLDEVSALVVAYLGCDPTDPEADPTVPDAVAIVVSRMVARVLEQSATTGTEATTTGTGPFSQTVRFAAGSTSGAPWLTKIDRLTLRPYRCDDGFSAVPISAGTTGRYRREVR